MKTPLFVFLGVVENGTNANLNTLKERLAIAFQELPGESKFEIKDELLTITIKPPRFCFYITFVKNEPQNVADWKEMAKNAELPWDIKHVDESRLRETIVFVERNGWGEYRSILNLGYIVLREMERFTHCKIFTIPSVGKQNRWSKFLGF